MYLDTLLQSHYCSNDGAFSRWMHRFRKCDIGLHIDDQFGLEAGHHRQTKYIKVVKFAFCAIKAELHTHYRLIMYGNLTGIRLL
jgi:hypothetical protein